MHLMKRLILAMMIALLGCVEVSAAVITNDVFRKDTSGTPIYAQGGGVFKFGGKYYWYGVKYNGAVTYANNPAAGENSDVSFNAFTCYSSTNLVDWTNAATLNYSNGLMPWVDTATTNVPYRFYRGCYVP